MCVFDVHNFIMGRFKARFDWVRCKRFKAMRHVEANNEAALVQCFRALDVVLGGSFASLASRACFNVINLCFND